MLDSPMFDFNLYCTIQCLTLTCITLSSIWLYLVLYPPRYFCLSQCFRLTCIDFFPLNIIVFLLCLPLILFFLNFLLLTHILLYSFNISMFSLTTIDTDDNQYIVMDRAYGPFQHCLFYLFKLLEFKAWINLSSGQIFKLLLLSIDNVPIF